MKNQNAKTSRPGRFPRSIQCRLSNEQYEKLCEAAQIAGMRPATYARHRLAGAHVSSKLDLQILNELRRQGGLAKLLATQGHDTSEALAEIVRTMQALQSRIERD